MLILYNLYRDISRYIGKFTIGITLFLFGVLFIILIILASANSVYAYFGNGFIYLYHLIEHKHDEFYLKGDIKQFPHILSRPFTWCDRLRIP